MAEHVLVETQGPWTGPAGERFLRDAAALARRGEPIRLYLAQEAVLATVGAGTAALRDLLALGVPVWVDDFALAERALSGADVLDGVEVTGIATLTETLLRDGVRVVWH